LQLLKKNFGYLIESPRFYEYLSAKQNLEILTRISDLGIDRIDYVLDLVELSSRCDDKVSAYSYGMKQRLGIAQTLLHNPKIIVLDEPNNGLDPNGISDMIKLIKKLKDEGKTICLSTHNLKDVEQICTDFTIFKNGVNTVVSSMQSQLQNSHIWLVNVAEYEKAINLSFKQNLILMLSPLAPHLAEELWSIIGNKNSVFNEKWPKYNPLKLQSDEMKLVIQVNGKVRANVSLSKSLDKEEVLSKCKELDNVSKYLQDNEIIKEIYVPEKIVNIVVRPK